MVHFEPQPSEGNTLGCLEVVEISSRPFALSVGPIEVGGHGFSVDYEGLVVKCFDELGFGVEDLLVVDDLIPGVC